MPARPGMATLIRRLRVAASAGEADFTLAGETYFSDAHLQAALDRTQRVHRNLPLEPQPVYEDGAYRYYDYGIPVGRYYEEAAEDSGWMVRDSRGAPVESALYTVDYDARRLRFLADQAGARYTLDMRSYDLNAAAAEIWEQKAAFAAHKTDWSSAGHGVQAGQEYMHCMARARYYRRMAGPKVTRLARLDEAG